MKILIICHYFPPLNSIASLRPYSYAKYWSEMGHAVTVMTTVKDRLDGLDIPANVQIEALSYWGSKFISTSKSLSQRDPASEHFFENKINKKILKRAVTWLRARYGILAAERIPEMLIAWYFSGRRYINQHIEEYDVVLSEYSPPTAIILGAYAKSLVGKEIKFVMDYRDSWTVSNYSQPGMPGFRWIEKIIENLVIKKADLICCAQSGIAKEFIDRGISNVAVIENGFFDDIPEANQDIDFSEISLVYTGSYGGYRNLDFLQEALDVIEERDPSLYSKITIYILGNGQTKCNHPKIKVLGKVDYAESLLYQKKSTILLLVESGRLIAKNNIPGKFFEYFRYEKPIIAFGPKESFEISRYLTENEIGIVSEATPVAAANAICHVLQNKESYGGKNLKRYSRKSKAMELLALIKGL